MNDAREILELLERPVDVRKLMKELSFDLDALEDANRRQSRLFLEAGRYLTGCVLQKARAENQLETTVAETGLKLRAEKMESTKKGLTEKAIEDVVNTSKEVRRCKQTFAMAKAAETWGKQLLEAYNHRLQVLGNLTKIRTGEMATSLRAVKEKAVVDDMERRADKVRRSFEDE